jgi:hypothetical protein
VDVDPVGYDQLLDNVSDEASRLDWRRGKPALGKCTRIAQRRIEGMGIEIEGCEGITDVGPRRKKRSSRSSMSKSFGGEPGETCR